jgi:acetolactate synthase-1/2/3 large subunit
MHFHEAMAHALRDQGVTDVFGVVGDANVFLMDSHQRIGGGAFRLTANEAGGVMAANGYARASGRVGVATVTHGPGLTNTVTALVEGVRDRNPILVIAGDTPAIDPYHLQAISQREIVLATGAGFEQLRAPETLADDLAVALSRAEVECRPIVLNVPEEFQWVETDYSPAHARAVRHQAIAPDQDALDEAVGIIASAARPVVLAGDGAIRPAARDALLRLAHRIGAPLSTTLRALGLFVDDPHDLGLYGVSSVGVSLETIQQADLVIVVGASLNRITTARGSLFAGKTVVQVDTDRAAFNRHHPVAAAVVSDAVPFTASVIAMLDEAEVPSSGFATSELAERLTADRMERYRDESTDTQVDIRTALQHVDAAFPVDRTLVLDTGRFLGIGIRHLHVEEPRALVTTVSFGSIGLGLGNAIGASFGRPDHPVLLITGDGGFMLGGLQEFNTAVRLGVDLVVVVLNDGAYGAEYVQFERRGLDPAITVVPWPELAPVATALGGQGYTVRNLADLDAVLAAIETRDRPVLIDVKIDPARVPDLGRN